MSDTDPDRASLVPVIRRAEKAAADEELVHPPVRTGVTHSDSLVLAAGDEEAGQTGRWLASDLAVDVADWA
jgi:hypothetical protein